MFRALQLLVLAAALATAFVPGCGKDKSPGPDTTPPAAVTDLTLLRTAETSLTVTWTAPGDDGDRGWAASYDLRYSLATLPAGWDSATVVQGLAIPQQAGSAETTTVTGLTRDLIYYLALRTLDDADNASDLSNVVQAQTADPTPPGQVTDLRPTAVEMEAVTLQFTAPGDDGYEGTATAYEVRYGPDPVTEETSEESAAFPITQAPRPAGTVETVRVTGLTPEATFHFAMRAQDDGGQWSPVSNNVEATLLGDTTPPAAIQDLAVSGTEPCTLTLSWTAPGDDGGEGQATSYALCYAAAAITEGTWGAATPVLVTLTPKEAGEREELTLTDLPGDKTLWFCMRALDEKGNLGAVSKAAKGYVRRPPRTWVVRVDGGGDAPTVQAGIDSSRHGDAVLVGPGTYYENVDLKGRQIHLKGAEGAEATVLDGSRGDNSVVTSNPVEYTAFTIEGFTITGGAGQPGCARLGGGLYSANTQLVLRSCAVEGNRVESTPPCFNSRGAGAYLSVPSWSPAAIIEDCLIEDNYSSGNAGGLLIIGPCVVQGNVVHANRTGKGDGGGVYVNALSGPIVIRGNLILENTANDHGGGIYIGNSSGPSSIVDVSENLIMSNVALGSDGAVDGSGGGCWMDDHGAHFHHNTVAFNRAERSLGDFVPTGGVHLLNPAGDVVVEHNLVCANSDGGITAFGLGGNGEQWVARLTHNLIFGNGITDTASAVWNGRTSIRLVLDECIFADPLFCVIGSDSRGELAYGSPALTQSFGVIGAVDHGSCDPSSATPIQRTTWEALKATYRR